MRIGAAGQASIPNSERIYVISVDRISSIKLNFNEKSMLSASRNLELLLVKNVSVVDRYKPQKFNPSLPKQ
jgi:hypothetical protein